MIALNSNCGDAGRGLGRKPFIKMIVAYEDDICVRCVESIPESLAIACRPASGAKKRNMPVREGACVRMCGEVGLQPLVLRRRCAASAGVSTVRV
jgi:hypothetical protein